MTRSYDGFFCSLCWNTNVGVYSQLTKQKLFCRYHLASGETKKIHIRDKRLIIRSLAERGHVVPNRLKGVDLYSRLSDDLTKLSVDPWFVIEKGRFNEAMSLLSSEFSQLVSRFYPITYRCIKACFKQQKVDDMVLSIVTEISKPSNSSKLSALGIEQNPVALRQLSTPKFLIHMLARHEAYQVIHEKPVKPGPIRKLYRDEKLRNKIIQLYNTFADAGNYRCQSRIAEQLGISTARVSVIMKELIREKKLTRKMT